MVELNFSSLWGIFMQASAINHRTLAGADAGQLSLFQPGDDAPVQKTPVNVIPRTEVEDIYPLAGSGPCGV